MSIKLKETEIQMLLNLKRKLTPDVENQDIPIASFRRLLTISWPFLIKSGL